MRTPTSPRLRRWSRLIVAVPLAVATTIIAVTGVASPAMAACNEPGHFYDITSAAGGYHLDIGPAFRDGPGGTVVGKVSTTGTITATASVSAGATVSGLVAEAKVEVSASMSYSVAITLGHDFSHDISPTKYGHLVFGAWADSVSWKYYHITPACKVVVDATGSNAHIPTGEIGWKYWETTS